MWTSLSTSCSRRRERVTLFFLVSRAGLRWKCTKDWNHMTPPCLTRWGTMTTMKMMRLMPVKPHRRRLVRAPLALQVARRRCLPNHCLLMTRVMPPARLPLRGHLTTLTIDTVLRVHPVHLEAGETDVTGRNHLDRAITVTDRVTGLDHGPRHRAEPTVPVPVLRHHPGIDVGRAHAPLDHVGPHHGATVVIVPDRDRNHLNHGVGGHEAARPTTACETALIVSLVPPRNIDSSLRPIRRSHLLRTRSTRSAVQERQVKPRYAANPSCRDDVLGSRLASFHCQSIPWCVIAVWCGAMLLFGPSC
eukprot:m.94095 g.94095  ORF g.94095 m.94095 type:complete len:304 (-) comp10034_c0_seq4:254-1165(-)